MMEILGKKISIIGAVKSGIGAAKLIRTLGGIPFISDSGKLEKLKDSVLAINELGINYEIGYHTDKIFDCELMIVSPGVPFNAAVLVNAREKNIKLISEIELAAAFCKGKIIAITGSNGKTTTTTLCNYLLNTCGFKSYAAGNIGVAFSEIALDVKENEFVSLEVSSFQLDLIDKFKPNVSVVLNITPDHLNRYEYKFENYISSKLRIYKNQDKGDFVIFNHDDKTLMDFTSKLSEDSRSFKSSAFYFSLLNSQSNGCFISGDEIIFNKSNNTLFRCKVKEFSLKGEHNLANAMAVISIAKLFNADNNKIIEALNSFQAIEHRLELVKEIRGVKFINDSKATNVDSVWYALRSFSEPIYLILGGQDKGNDYNQIKDLVVERVVKIYAIGSSAEKVFNFFHLFIKVEIKQSLEDAVTAASEEAKQNEVVLLSPACASFDMFNSYEHRGRIFKEAVNRL
ncbi:MAG: UDP-N-acetylmuramoyl-L-alanine--D-glutamate ligase [Ignavibacteriaceae bacterium]